jgi:xanthine dehydrogenase/oxidase
LCESSSQSGKDNLQGYDVWSILGTEVEVDVLTGEYKISRADFTIQGTHSLNPEVDLGQVEGGLIFALGLWTTEQLQYDAVSGQLLTANSWHYKPPMPKDIPEDWRVTLLTSGNPNPYGVLGSKGLMPD